MLVIALPSVDTLEVFLGIIAASQVLFLVINTVYNFRLVWGAFRLKSDRIALLLIAAVTVILLEAL
jgi:hypothetical protein